MKLAIHPSPKHATSTVPHFHRGDSLHAIESQRPRYLSLLSVLLVLLVSYNSARAQQGPVASDMAGYLLVPNDRVDDAYNAGFSMYVAAWPLLENYPGNRFQTGLFGTWMHPWYAEKPSERLYNDIEGGLGWWRDTRFATETPKFIMGGVTLNFSAWANGPGAGKGRDWNRPNGKYAVIQLSPWVIWPPDGLNLKQGTCGELFGYGYLPLPLTDARETTAGAEVPTGNQCWTLFVNSGNFKGPITFFAPYFWSQPTIERPELAGMFLDTRPSNPNRALQMETQYVPAFQATDKEGNQYARIAPTRFPANERESTMVVHRVTSYQRDALWNGVQNWFDGGEPSSGRIDPKAAVIHRFPGRGGATWRIYEPKTERDERIPVNWTSFAEPTAIADDTFGYKWNADLVGSEQVGSAECVTLPQYYQLTTNERGRKQWTAVAASNVPEETELHSITFDRAPRPKTDAYETPEEETSSWKQPGPVSGPHYAYPGDGSVVTYYWYRFADQPALFHADLTDEERETLQARVEKLHRHWTKEREYLPPPTRGQLADIDPNLIVTPPPGFEVGYVPIVTRQGPKP